MFRLGHCEGFKALFFGCIEYGTYSRVYVLYVKYRVFVGTFLCYVQIKVKVRVWGSARKEKPARVASYVLR